MAKVIVAKHNKYQIIYVLTCEVAPMHQCLKVCSYPISVTGSVKGFYTTVMDPIMSRPVLEWKALVWSHGRGLHGPGLVLVVCTIVASIDIP